MASQLAVSTACLEADKQWHVARGLTPQTMLCSDRSRRVPLAMASAGWDGWPGLNDRTKRDVCHCFGVLGEAVQAAHTFAVWRFGNKFTASSRSAGQQAAGQQAPVAPNPGGGGFFDSIGNSFYSMGQSYYALGQYAGGNAAGGDQTLANAYTRGPLGQAEQIGPGTYAATAASLGVAAAATTAVVGMAVAGTSGPVIFGSAATGGAPIAGVGSSVLPNTLHHIFGRLIEHKLAGLLASCGGNQVAAFTAIEAATITELARRGIASGIIDRIVVNVNGLNVTVSGRVMDGVLRISSAFIP